MKIYVATFTGTSGYGKQKVFKIKSKAQKWLEKQFYLDSFSKDKTEFEEWCQYGCWTGKIKCFSL